MGSHAKTFRATVAGATLAAASTVWAGAAATPAPDINEGHRRVQIASTDAPVHSFQREGRIFSLYGRPMTHGATVDASATQFIDQNIGVFGITADELRAGIEYADGASTKGLMYDKATGEYKFTLVRYTQHLDNIPVFRSELKLMVNNTMEGNPVVLANANLRPLAGFDLDAARREMLSSDASRKIAETEMGEGGHVVGEPKLVIWAGVDTRLDVPALATQYIVERGVWPNIEKYQKFLYLVDVQTGRVLFAEDQVMNVDVVGNVSAYTTDGTTADPCTTQSLRPLPFAKVSIGGTEVFADANGDFTIPNAGTDPVTVEASVLGQWFFTQNLGGPDSSIALNVTPPGPANFEFNLVGAEFETAEVNAYYQAQLVRDYVLSLDPDFPIFDGVDEPFRIDVNDTSSCNAFYQGNNLLFLRAQDGGCPNSAYSSIVYHEYGHHLVARATGSQCQWGEGNSDVTSTMVTDEPELAFGFFGDCNTPLRNADNECQYDPDSCSSCGGPCHNCGQLISGCVWDLRNNLLVTEPASYRTIAGQLWLASLFTHSTGTEITPADTINYLVADDDDGNLDNGTPHYAEIAAAFGDHNMPAPPLILLAISLPDGAPEFTNPSGTTTVRVLVSGTEIGAPKPDSGVLYVDDGNGVQPVPMVEVSANEYEGTFPAFACGTPITYYFSAETTLDEVVYFPRDAEIDATLRFRALAAFSLDPGFADDFESDLGWTVVTDAQRGFWERGVPQEDCGQGQPDFDADGSGSCYVTWNNCANSDIDNGSTILTSPILDASNPESLISYWRWYDNFFSPVFDRDDPLIIEVSNDAGQNWVLLEQVGPDGDEADGGWFLKLFRVADFVAPSDEFQIRFIASDLGGADQVEAGVDGVVVINPVCTSCPEDLDGSKSVDFQDILRVLTAWGPCGPVCPEDLDMSGEVDFEDILAILGAWGPCP